jgi:hypothetical protein
MEIPTFDGNGYLTPHQIIHLSLTEIERLFTYNSQRKELFVVLEGFLGNLKFTLIAPFQVWIDGSFITTKEFPNDIDLVIFVNANEYEHWKNRLWGFKDIYKYQGLDVHLVCVFPHSSRKRIETEYSTNDYYKLFNLDRQNVKKGFIQLKFS